ncbi:hypothetical protein QRQ56_22680 [Bradyrhizobium sp. U531]|uniref:hypothetical protein n=1 Tax=Bradyrhizobium sp. U531 TaxID=3053458 RepID=UPI003F437C4A
MKAQTAGSGRTGLASDIERAILALVVLLKSCLAVRKDLLRIRATARPVETRRSAFFGPGRREPSHHATVLDDAPTT